TIRTRPAWCTRARAGRSSFAPGAPDRDAPWRPAGRFARRPAILRYAWRVGTGHDRRCLDYRIDDSPSTGERQRPVAGRAAGCAADRATLRLGGIAGGRRAGPRRAGSAPGAGRRRTFRLGTAAAG